MGSNAQKIVPAVSLYRQLFAGIFIVCVLASVAAALIIKPTYRSEVLVGPVPDDGSANVLGGLSGQLGGLASLTGVSIGKGGRNWDAAVAVLRSRHLAERLVVDQNLMAQLFSNKGTNGGLLAGGTGARQPTIGDAVYALQRNVLAVHDDVKTGLVSVRVDLHDPKAAADAANALVRLADDEMRASTIADTEASLVALRKEYDETSAAEVRSAIARLIETQLKSRVAAQTRAQYVFKVIDPAVPSDLHRRLQPTRTVMVLAGALLGLLLGMLACVVRYDLSRARSE